MEKAIMNPKHQRLLDIDNSNNNNNSMEINKPIN